MRSINLSESSRCFLLEIRGVFCYFSELPFTHMNFVLIWLGLFIICHLCKQELKWCSYHLICLGWNFTKPTCVYAQWPHMRHILSVCDLTKIQTRQKVTGATPPMSFSGTASAVFYFLQTHLPTFFSLPFHPLLRSQDHISWS